MSYLNPYSIFIDLKNYLYDQKIFAQIKTDTKIISIGNLNTGGSGKTPIIQFLAQNFKHKKILIVCKSYKAQLIKPSAVDLSNPQAVEIYGDEACLLKKLLPGCDVWSGPQKSKTVVAAIEAFKKYDVIFIDDGFSHRKLFRNLDIILVDASRTPSHYQLFPWGHMRESWKTLKRADLVVLTKTEGLTSEKRKYFADKIHPYQKHLIESQFQSALDSDNKKLFLATGIGNPDKLKTDLVNLGYSIDKQKYYPDHFSFPMDEQIKLLVEAESHPELQLVMTAKDLIKITNTKLIEKIKQIHLEIYFTESDRKILNEKILS